MAFSYDPATNDLLSVSKPATAQFPAGVTKSFEYENHHVKRIKDAKSQYFVENFYDAQGRVERQNLGGNNLVFDYSVADQVTETDRKGFRNVYSFNAAGNMVKKEEKTGGLRLSDPASFVTTYTYNTDSMMTSVTYPAGNGAVYLYDETSPNPRSWGNLLQVRRKSDMAAADNNTNDIVISMTYEPLFNQINAVTDPQGHVTVYTYDHELNVGHPKYGTKGDLVFIDQPAVALGMPTTEFTYNSFGQVTEVVDPNGNVTRYAYFPTTGYLQSVTQDPTGINAVTQFTYDSFGNLDVVSDANNHATDYDYDELGWLNKVVNPLGFVTKHTFDANGNIIKTERQVDAASARVALNGQDVTASAAVTPEGFSFTAAGLSEGAQTLEIYVRDLSGNSASVTVHFTVDIDAGLPEITDIQPVEGVVLKDASPVLAAAFTDADSGVDGASVKIVLDGQDITAMTGAGPGGFNFIVTPDLADGTHTLTIEVSDLSGNRAAATRTFTTDVTAPVIGVAMPADGSLWGTAAPQIAGVWSDAATAVNPSSAKMWVDDVPVALTDGVLTAAEFQVALTVLLADGTHTLKVEVDDTAGNRGTAVSGFTTDITPPVVGGLTPTQGSVLLVNLPTISLNYSDATSGIDPAGVTLAVDGTDVTARATVSETMLSYVPDAALADGAHTVSARVADVADNVTDTAWNFQVMTDHVPPVVSGLTPADGAYVNSAAPVLSGDFSDNLSGVNPSSAALTLDTVDITAGAEITAAGFSVTPAAGLSEGSHRLGVTVRDNSGNAGAASATFTVDTVPPVVTTLRSPAANAAGWNNTDVAVSFAATDVGSGIQSVSPLEIVAAEGAGRTVTGTATDRAGNSASASVVVNIDKTFPLVTITAPADGVVVYGPTMEVTATVTDTLSGAGEALCNGTPAALTGNDFTCTAALTPGDNTVTVTVADLAGNVTSASVTARRVVGASIAITSPASLITVGASPIDVTGSVSGNAVSVFVNGVTAAVVNGTFTVNGVVLSEGLNTIVAAAYDALDNVTTASVNVTLDSTPPKVEIISPKDGETRQSSPITVSGLINDIVRGTVNADGAQVLVNGVPAVVSNRGFIAEDVALVEGANVITAVGADAVGNISQKSITVTLDTTPIRGLTVIGGDNQTGTVGSDLPQALRVALKDAAGQPVAGGRVIFKVVDNNGRLSGAQIQVPSPDGRMAVVETDAGGTAQVNWQLGTWAGAGNQRVEVSSLGVRPRVTFTASGSAGAAAYVHVGSGGNQRGAVGHLLPEPLVATVTDAGHNPVAGVAVNFTVKEGGGVFTNNAPTMTVNTDSDGRATVNMVLGSAAGNDAHTADADFAGNIGAPAVFTATGLVPGHPGETRITGVILDNTDRPVPGVTVRVDGTTRQGVSDGQGQFLINNVLVGPVHLVVDGSTATVPGEWPLLSFELTTIAGADNTLGKPIYLLPIDTARAKRVGGAKDVVYTLPEVPGFSLTVKAGSVTFPDGSKEGLISVTPVHMDKVPMAPPYGLQSRFMITVQPPGAVFEPPAALTLPNTDALAAGEKVNLFSFDHDLGAFVSIGPGSVSADGLRVESDPGVGVIKAGWHCGANPQPVGMCVSAPAMCGGQLAGCGACETCDTTNCWRIPGCYEFCGAVRCGSCEDCVNEKCVLETGGIPACQPIPGSCQDCPVELDCVTCENNICIFRGCGGPADDDGTCVPGCDTCTHCSQGRCYPDDVCADDGSSCAGTCGTCGVCRNDSCARDGRCDLDDEESNGNEGDSCDGALPCRECLTCVNGACAVNAPQACQDNLSVTITPMGPVVMGVGITRPLRVQGGPLAGTYSWTSSNPAVARLQGSTTTQNVTVEGLAPGTAVITVSFTAQSITVTDTVEVTVVEVEIVDINATEPNNTKVNYLLSPLTATINTAIFVAPGVTQTKTNLTGAFSFSFDQNNLLEGSNLIQLKVEVDGFVLTRTVVANNERKTFFDNEFTSLMVPFSEGGVEGIITVPVEHNIFEIFNEFTYSAPVNPSSKTIKVGHSGVNIEIPDLLLGSDQFAFVAGAPIWIEEHFYRTTLGDQLLQIMADPLGPTLPPQTTRYRSKNSSDDMYYTPSSLKEGLAHLVTIMLDDGLGVPVLPLAIINEEIEVVFP